MGVGPGEEGGGGGGGGGGAWWCGERGSCRGQPHTAMGTAVVASGATSPPPNVATSASARSNSAIAAHLVGVGRVIG